MGKEEATVEIETNWEMWRAIESRPDPVVALHARAQEELLRGGYSYQEVGFVSRDPVFNASVRDCYYETESEIHEKNRVPKSVKVHFTRPGTRDKRGREEPAPSPVE